MAAVRGRRRLRLAFGAALSLLLTAATISVASADSAASISTAPPRLPAPVACAHCWRPPLHTRWDWVLSVVPKAPYRAVSMYDIDAFDATASDVSAMHAAGIKVVCYVSAGTFEDWRPDAAQIPARLLGRTNGWPGERWLDIREAQRSHSVLRRIMDARLDMCRNKGFDGVELDNVDGYTNRTGFPLSAADQAYYDATLANDAHRRGLMVLQKNDNAQIPLLLPYFDAALNEECNQYRECTTKQTGSYGYDQYIAAGKAVFQAEYALTRARFCEKDEAARFNGVRFDLDLDGAVFKPCR